MSAIKRILYVFPLAMNLKAHWADRVRETARSGYDVHIAIPHETLLQELELGAVTWHNLPLRRGRPSVGAEIAYIMALARTLRAVKPDLLHAITVRPVIYGGLLARLLRVPAALFSVTGLGYLFIGTDRAARLLRPLGEEAYALALHHRNSAALFENPADRDLFVKRGLVELRNAHVVLGGGIDLEAFSYVEEPSTEIPLVVLPSRLLIDKGVREFVEAARRLKAEGVSARFALVGEPDPGNPATLEQSEIDGWQRDSIIEAWGWRDDIADVIRQANIVCLPSYREGAPRALIEAAAIGRAVVTTDVPGCIHVVERDRTALVVPARDSHALKDALKRLLTDPDLRTRMGKAGRSFAEEHFSSALAASKMLALYDLLVQRRPGKRAKA